MHSLVRLPLLGYCLVVEKNVAMDVEIAVVRGKSRMQGDQVHWRGCSLNDGI